MSASRDDLSAGRLLPGSNGLPAGLHSASLLSHSQLPIGLGWPSARVFSDAHGRKIRKNRRGEIHGGFLVTAIAGGCVGGGRAVRRDCRARVADRCCWGHRGRHAHEFRRPSFAKLLVDRGVFVPGICALPWRGVASAEESNASQFPQSGAYRLGMFSVDHVIARAGVVAGEIAGVGGWRGADPFPDIDFAAAIAAGQTLLDSLGEGKSMMSSEGLDRSPVAPIAMA